MSQWLFQNLGTDPERLPVVAGFQLQADMNFTVSILKDVKEIRFPRNRAIPHPFKVNHLTQSQSDVSVPSPSGHDVSGI